MENEKLYFTTVAGLEGGAAVVGGHLAREGLDPSLTRFMFVHDSKWGHWFDIEDVVYATVSRPRSARNNKANVAALTRNGRLWEMASGAQPQDWTLDVAGGYYLLLGLALVGDDLWCCGVQNMVFRVMGTAINRNDQGLFTPLSGQVDRVLESIAGFGSDDVYAVGHSGMIWHWNGQIWNAEPSLTNLDLFAVCCASSGKVYVAGGGGAVLRRESTGQWTDLTSPDLSDATVRGIAEFGEQVYLAAGSKLFVVRGNGIVEVVVRELPEVEGKFHAISSDRERLWTAGDDGVLCFDGSSWTGFKFP